VIPPNKNSEFVACMEDVLNIYSMPYDPDFPVLCMDEQPVQLLKETRTPIPATLGHPRRVDYEYERAGTASIFMFTEPLSGWRDVSVRPQRKKVDWAIEMADLLDNRYAKAKNTKGAFYEVFSPEQARKIIEKIEFHYTPKHGSWLNVAENELSSMTRQCLKDRKMTNIEILKNETSAWATNSNEKQRGVNWQFKVEDARRKLRSLYPNI
jgi:hypothetical protein